MLEYVVTWNDQVINLHVFIRRRLDDIGIYNPYADSSNPASEEHAGVFRLPCGCDEGGKYSPGWLDAPCCNE